MSSPTFPRFAFGAGLLALALVACAAHTETPPPAGSDSVIMVGLQSDDMGTSVASLHVTATIGGVSLADQTIPVVGAATFPKEVRLTAPAGTPDQPVLVKVEAFPAGSGAMPILQRSATTRFVTGKTKLLRLHLEAHCLTALSGGALGAPACAAPMTCMAGTCRDDGSDVLEEYVPAWPMDAPDICKPAGHGDPQVLVGTGQTDYLPLTDGQTVQAELGPQGGHHVWIAVRMRNLKQSGSTITLNAVQPGTGIAVLQTAFVFTFDRDEGGYCKVSGLRFQLDLGATSLRDDYKKYLGKPLDISVEVADPAGTHAKATAHVNIASTIICPSSIPDCY